MRILFVMLIVLPNIAFAEWEKAGVLEKGALYAWDRHEIASNGLYKGMVKFLDYRNFSHVWVQQINCKTRENSALYGFMLDQTSNFMYDLPSADKPLVSSKPGTPLGNTIDIVCRSRVGALPDKPDHGAAHRSSELGRENTGGNTYTGTDDNGTIVLTDDPTKVPKAKRSSRQKKY